MSCCNGPILCVWNNGVIKKGASRVVVVHPPTMLFYAYFIPHLKLVPNARKSLKNIGIHSTIHDAHTQIV